MLLKFAELSFVVAKRYQYDLTKDTLKMCFLLNIIVLAVIEYLQKGD